MLTVIWALVTFLVGPKYATIAHSDIVPLGRGWTVEPMTLPAVRALFWVAAF